MKEERKKMGVEELKVYLKNPENRSPNFLGKSFRSIKDVYFDEEIIIDETWLTDNKIFYVYFENCTFKSVVFAVSGHFYFYGCEMERLTFNKTEPYTCENKEKLNTTKTKTDKIVQDDFKIEISKKSEIGSLSIIQNFMFGKVDNYDIKIDDSEITNINYETQGEPRDNDLCKVKMIFNIKTSIIIKFVCKGSNIRSLDVNFKFQNTGIDKIFSVCCFENIEVDADELISEKIKFVKSKNVILNYKKGINDYPQKQITQADDMSFAFHSCTISSVKIEQKENMYKNKFKDFISFNKCKLVNNEIEKDIGKICIDNVNNIEVSEMDIYGEMDLKFIKNIKIHSIKIYGAVSIENNDNSAIELTGTNIEKNASCYILRNNNAEIELNNISCYSEKFIFNENTPKSLLIKWIDFYGKEIFSLNDFSNTKFDIKKPCFVNVNFNNNSWGKITNNRFNGDRDSYRYLKYSLESIGNKIEANAFHAIELEKAIIEKNIPTSDKIILWVNKIISNFSQSWLLPILWYFSIAFFFFVFYITTWEPKTFFGIMFVIFVLAIYPEVKNSSKWLLNGYSLLICLILYFIFCAVLTPNGLVLMNVDYTKLVAFIFPAIAIAKTECILSDTYYLLLLSFCQIFQFFVIYQLQVSLRKNTRK